MIFLPEIVYVFPKCNANALGSCLQLILLLEILKTSSNNANVFSFFPSTFRSSWMKGAYLSEGKEDTVQKNLQIKRIKVTFNCSDL